MAMTELLLVWLGTLAVVASLGLFYQFRDRWSGVLVELTASVLWGVFAIGAMEFTGPNGAESALLLTYVGIAFALVTFAFTLYDLVAGVGSEATSADINDIG